MPGKQVDLSGKSVYYLEQDQFEKLFCRYCKERKSCKKTQQAIHSCMGLVDSGVWDATLRKRGKDINDGDDVT